MSDEPRARGAGGQYIRTVDTAERDRAAAELYSQGGYSYQRIANELGYANKGSAHHAVRRALKAIVQDTAQEVRTMELARLDAELARLDGLEESVRTVLERQHITVNNGRIIYIGEEPLVDDAPVLQAVDRLLKIEESRRRNGESRRKLLGLDEPVKTQLSGGVTFEIVGVDMSKLR